MLLIKKLLCILLNSKTLVESELLFFISIRKVLAGIITVSAIKLSKSVVFTVILTVKVALIRRVVTLIRLTKEK